MPRVIPFGNRLLVKRRKTGDVTDGKFGGTSLVMPDTTKDRETELADVVYIPEHSFADIELINNAETIIKSLTKKARDGDSEALKALLEYNIFLKIKSIQVGDVVMISKYVGTSFEDNQGSGNLTLIYGSDIIGVVAE